MLTNEVDLGQVLGLYMDTRMILKPAFNDEAHILALYLNKGAKNGMGWLI